MNATTALATATTDELVASLDALLDEAGRVELDDAVWDVLARRARNATAQLADTGHLPRTFVVALTDPPVVIARLLAVARAAATRPVATRATARCA